jgi:hypothetical protein
MKKKYNLTDIEVKNKLTKFEWDTLKATGIRHLSGGFVEAEVFGMDKEYFDVELKWGVQNDCENRVHTEQYKMNRETLELEDA